MMYLNMTPCFVIILILVRCVLVPVISILQQRKSRKGLKITFFFLYSPFKADHIASSSERICALRR